MLKDCGYIFYSPYNNISKHFIIVQQGTGIIVDFHDFSYQLKNVFLLNSTSSMKDTLIDDSYINDFTIDLLVKTSHLPPINYPNMKVTRLYQNILICTEEDLLNVSISKSNKITDLNTYLEYISFYKKHNVFDGFFYSKSLKNNSNFFFLESSIIPLLESKNIYILEEHKKLIYDFNKKENFIIENNPSFLLKKKEHLKKIKKKNDLDVSSDITDDTSLD